MARSKGLEEDVLLRRILDIIVAEDLVIFEGLLRGTEAEQQS